jgi:hypothetical protein
MAALLSLANDDVNYSSRDRVELTDLYNYWYATTWQGLDETVYTGFTPTGSVYGYWRGYIVFPLTAYVVTNSVVSPPSLTAGIWAKNFAHHFYLDSFPPCPAQEMEYGQSFSAGSSTNSYLPNVPGLAALVSMYQGTNEGEYLNYWMQNIWNNCWNPAGTLPESSPMWTAANLDSGGLSNAYQSYFYLCTDPEYPSNSNLPTGSVDNYADNASSTSGTPMAGMMSRTGYSSVTDTLVMFYARRLRRKTTACRRADFCPPIIASSRVTFFWATMTIRELITQADPGQCRWRLAATTTSTAMIFPGSIRCRSVTRMQTTPSPAQIRRCPIAQQIRPARPERTPRQSTGAWSTSRKSPLRISWSPPTT